MLAEAWNEDRNRYLSHLDVHANFSGGPEYFLPPPLSLAFAEMVNRAVHLEDLDIDSFDSLLEAGGTRAFELLRDLSSHHKLKKLTVHNVGERTVQLLEVMVSSSVTDLSLSYKHELESPDPFPALKSFCSTITILEPEWVYPESLTVKCPRLHTLSLQTLFPLTICALVFAFPNLLRLTLPSQASLPEEDDIEAMRLSNQDDLAQPNGSWTHLDYLRGDTIHLYMMGLSCPVYELSVGGVTTADVSKVVSLLDDLSPQVVHLFIRLGGFSLEVFGAFLQSAVQILNDSCSHLDLNIQLQEVTLDIQEIVVRRPSPLALQTIIDSLICSVGAYLGFGTNHSSFFGNPI